MYREALAEGEEEEQEQVQEQDQQQQQQQILGEVVDPVGDIVVENNTITASNQDFMPSPSHDNTMETSVCV